MAKKDIHSNAAQKNHLASSEDICAQDNSLYLDIKKGLAIQHQLVNQQIEKDISSVVLSQIHDYVLNHEPFDSGTEGVVYKVPIHIDGSISYFLVAKKRYDHDIHQEYENHKYLSSLLQDQYDFKQHVDIPKLYGKFDDATNNESYIIMDYIQGKTFFATLVEKISSMHIENDKQAEKILHDMFFEKKGYATSQFSDIVDFLKQHIQANNIKLFSFAEGVDIKQALKKFLKHIHNQGFYHRDMGNNLRNIMIGDDKKIYVIDFGCSTIVDKHSVTHLSSDEIKEIYYSGHKDTIAHYYAYDESFLDTVDALTYKPPRKDPRELSY